MTTVSSRRRAARAMIAFAAIAAASACGQGQPKIPELRFWTDDLAFRVSSDPVPPRARERIVYKVVVRDKESGQPIEGGHFFPEAAPEITAKALRSFFSG